LKKINKHGSKYEKEVSLMALSEEQIQRLIEWFVNLSETKRIWSEPRRKALEKNHRWIQPQTIREMSDNELTERFLEYYKSGGGRQNLNQIYRDRIIRDRIRFRETLFYLLNEDVDIRERIDEVLGGRYYIEGMGKAIVTSFLMDFNPEKYCLWNNKTMMGLSVIGWDVYREGNSLGTVYVRVIEALQRLKDLKSEFNLNFDDIDLFLHTISAEEEGKRAIEAVIENREILRPTVEEKGQIYREVESMEFAMEKSLEEFIEANFSRIFGANLELYQTEENNGRQYPTTIGNIDLLAVDKERKEFVVIELKKGKNSDDVVGQILRYMGWVKENLAANDYRVRGIIIVKEKDKRLEYALKCMPNVELFIYKVYFEVKKI